MRKWRTVRILANGTVVLIYAVALRVRFFIYLSGLCIKTNVLIKHNKVKRLIAPVSRKSVLLGSVYYYKTLTSYFTLTLIAESPGSLTPLLSSRYLPEDCRHFVSLLGNRGATWIRSGEPNLGRRRIYPGKKGWMFAFVPRLTLRLPVFPGDNAGGLINSGNNSRISFPRFRSPEKYGKATNASRFVLAASIDSFSVF